MAAASRTVSVGALPEPLRTPAVLENAGQYDEQIAAQRRDGLLDQDLRALSDGQHQDHRAHADHHAQHGEEGAQLVGGHRLPGFAEQVADHGEDRDS